MSRLLGRGGTERRARVITLALFLLATAALLFGILRPDDAIDLVARQPGAGGWSRERIVVNQGERVRLRIRSEDVVHGFAIGRLGVDAGPIEPGKVKAVEFVASEPGEYTFYCTEWCDPHHPRMRGVLEVRGPDAPTGQAPPPDAALPHTITARTAPVVPADRPAASRGRALYDARCAACHGSQGAGTAAGPPIADWSVLSDWSPVQAFRALRGNVTGSAPAELHGTPTTPTATGHVRYAAGWSDQAAWDVVASLWAFSTAPQRLEFGHRLFARNCAACHGEGGGGDGPGGKHQPKAPANFTDPRRMLAGTSALYLATIRRGGMGSGMPYWGGIFTEEELRALVDAVWSFSLNLRSITER